MNLDIKQSWANIANQLATSEDENTFHTWFNTSKDMHESIANGSVDFYHRIFTLDLYDYIDDPREKTCLELGFGGGRLLRAALEIFQTAYGIDVSSEQTFNIVGQFLNKFVYNKDRFNLIHRDNTDSIPDNSIDFVYSFIVFQHFSSIEEVEFYVKLCKRVMKYNAIGKIFFTAGDRQVTQQEFANNPRVETLFIQPQEFKNLLLKYDLNPFNDVHHAGKKQLWSNPNNLSSQHIIQFCKD